MNHARVLIVVAVLCSFCALGAAPALGAYPVVGKFADTGSGPGGQGSEAGQLSNPNQLDVNDTTGNVYVADTGNNRIQFFKPNAEAAEYEDELGITAPTGLAIDQAGGDVYVSTPTGISKYTVGLTPAANWTDPGVTGALAVDPSTHDLLVADTAANLIRRFEADGTPAGSFTAERPIDVAVDAGGDVFVVTTSGDIAAPPCGATSAVERFSSAGVSEGTLGNLTIPGAVDVDPDDGTIVVADRVNEYFCEAGNVPRIAFFDGTGSFEEATALPAETMYAMVPGLAAAGGTSNRVYAETRSPMNDIFGATAIFVLEEVLSPVVTVAPAGGVGPSAAVLNGTVDPEGLEITCDFVYGTGGEETSVPCSPQPGTGTDPVPVEAGLSGLSPGTTYSYRIEVTALEGLISVTSEEESFTTDSVAPSVETMPAGQVSQTGAILRASINPGGEPTTYYFEYGLDTNYGSKVPVGGDAEIGAGSVAELATRSLTGLQPGTVYHFRVVAQNSLGTSFGEDRSFMTSTAPVPCANEAVREKQGTQFLPDCRAYEMVSPPQKNGIDVSGYEHSQYKLDFTPMTSGSGEAAAFTAHGAFAGALSNTVYSTYLARRGPDGWSTRAISPRANGDKRGAPRLFFLQFSEDYSDWFLVGFNEPQPGPGAVEGTQNAWLGGDAGYRLLSPGQSDDQVIYTFGGWSEDQRKVVFRLKEGTPLTPDAPIGAEEILYEWDSSTGQVSLVGKEPGTNLPFQTSTEVATPDLDQTGAGVADASLWNPVSRDGSKIYFYAPLAPDQQLYLRLDGTSTRHVSKSQRGVPDPNGTQPATFHFASTDGDVAFLSSAEKLTDDATTGPLSTGRDLYRYDVGSGELTDITVDPDDPNGAEVRGVLGGSESGDRLYFVAEGALAPGAVPGADNLYLWSDDGSAKGQIEFISVGVDEENWYRLTQGDPRRTARVTPDGMHVMFQSRQRITAYDNDGHFEAYLYDAAEDELTCASCNPSGVPATANAMAIGTGDSVSEARTLSADGRYVFFGTTEGLVATDVNNRLDAYRFDSALGRVDLLSPGTGEFPAEFQDASADGGSAVFTTRQRLLTSDFDTNVDVYSARVGGGFLSQSPPPPPVPCFGEACRSEPAVPPQPANPASAHVVGKGNVKHGKTKKAKKKQQKKAKKKKKKRKSSQQRKQQQRQGGRR